ncbi:hypothetical protein Q4S45_16355 [Massilia sp. R2A-15]|uniref:hypothetical protein n=1 Tax=Massilia sp. R2A-15 TaxID=3064278 RepID=UPI0027345B01|nr:hypothetical protein [Massilia sp. R2A-15]WLI88296.1 hypothetical protein Q4S45_16355 [Massilia sp. R2A-15]
MNVKFAALATTCLLATGCAMNGPINPPQSPNDSSPVAGATTSGSSAAGTQQAAGSEGRTRAEVYAEAVETVKHYKSTQSEERDYFNPFAH